MIQLHETWYNALEDYLETDEFNNLILFLEAQKIRGNKYYPEDSQIFRALNLTPLDKVKVVILGQDPYYNGQANGLAFSVDNEEIPSSLKNIYKEVSENFNCEIPENGDLTFWAKQGVLLLNSVLTVEAGNAGSHRKYGWEQFTDHIIKVLNNSRVGIVFMLWGFSAKKKAKFITKNRHFVLKAANPSTLTVKNFLGCKHFLECNNFLKKKNRQVIKWVDISDKQWYNMNYVGRWNSR